MLGPSITNWSCIWNLHVSSKIKIFIRQSLSDCLATMKALSGRKVDVEYVCPICQQEEESDFRALISCSFARCVWIDGGNHNYAVEHLRNRNSVVWTGKMAIPAWMISLAVTLLRQIVSTNTSVKMQNSGAATSTSKWQRLPVT
ncbi:hypothetical protein LguiB_023256 [Lonicera macranthoides]